MKKAYAFLEQLKGDIVILISNHFYRPKVFEQSFKMTLISLMTMVIHSDPLKLHILGNKIRHSYGKTTVPLRNS